MHRSPVAKLNGASISTLRPDAIKNRNDVDETRRSPIGWNGVWKFGSRFFYDPRSEVIEGTTRAASIRTSIPTMALEQALGRCSRWVWVSSSRAECYV